MPQPAVEIRFASNKRHHNVP